MDRVAYRRPYNAVKADRSPTTVHSRAEYGRPAHKEH
jgi:hypothetical protein